MLNDTPFETFAALKLRADAEHQRVERLLAQLRALGLESAE
jgi:hypothetical protein